MLNLALPPILILLTPARLLAVLVIGGLPVFCLLVSTAAELRTAPPATRETPPLIMLPVLLSPRLRRMEPASVEAGRLAFQSARSWERDLEGAELEASRRGWRPDMFSEGVGG